MKKQQINQARLEIQLQCVEALQKAHFNGVGIMPTGSGKGFVLVECLKRIKPEGRIWYLCDSEENRDKTFRAELEKWGAEEWVDRIEFMCYQSAYKFEGEAVELCLADEFDYAITPEYFKAITNNHFKHLICVSATLTPEKRKVVKDELLPIVFEKELREIEELGILNAAKHYLVNFKLNDKENRKYLDFNSRFVRLLDDKKRNSKQLEMLQIQRKHFLSSLVTARNICRRLLKDLYPDERNKVVVFCGLSDQADSICKFSYHSKSTEDYLTPFDKGEIRVLSVVGKIDRGVNLNGVNNIIFESPTKSTTKFVQRSGRGRRLDVDDILDIYYLIPHYVDRRGQTVPTVVKSWVQEATSKINFKPQIYQFK